MHCSTCNDGSAATWVGRCATNPIDCKPCPIDRPRSGARRETWTWLTAAELFRLLERGEREREREREEAEICRRYCHFKELLLLLKFGMKTAKKRWKKRERGGEGTADGQTGGVLLPPPVRTGGNKSPLSISLLTALYWARSDKERQQHLTSLLSRTHVSLQLISRLN